MGGTQPPPGGNHWSISTDPLQPHCPGGSKLFDYSHFDPPVRGKGNSGTTSCLVAPYRWHHNDFSSKRYWSKSGLSCYSIPSLWLTNTINASLYPFSWSVGSGLSHPVDHRNFPNDSPCLAIQASFFQTKRPFRGQTASDIPV